ncbi:MAG: rhomboid family intramembrane serine protease [Pseudolabrys sp.]|nr:rhomboid family intramembrane serine protease [Pseudolabrys sp.]
MRAGLTAPVSDSPSVQREPIFNIPGVIVALLGVLLVVHVVRLFVLSERQDIQVLLLFAFIPARYDSTAAILGDQWPGGVGSEIWTFVTYSFLHVDWMHLIVNSLWLLPFGSAVARRFGAARFVLFFAVTSAAGALAQLAAHSGGRFVMIGASAAISGMMAAAMRFAFQGGGPLGFWRESEDQAYYVPALPLSGVLRDPRIIGFVVVWFGVNLLFGLGSVSLGNGDQPIAWQAHVGGFVAGLLLFGFFDPVSRRRSANAG